MLTERVANGVYPALNLASANGADLVNAAAVRCVVLISKLSGFFDLGDIVMSNAVVRFIRLQFPSARIVLFARAEEIARYRERFYVPHSWIDEFHVCPSLEERSARPWLRFYLALRGLKADLCIANIGSVPAWFMFLAGVPLRMGVRPSSAWSARLLTRAIPMPLGPPFDIHWSDVVIAYVKALGGPDTFKVQNVVPFVRYEKEPVPPVRDGPGDCVVAMHVGGAMHWNRRWPRDSYLEICVRLVRRKSAAIVLMGGEEERAEIAWLIDRLKRLCPHARVHDFSGCSINRLLNVYAETDLYIGNDSGLMHLAVALGVPTIALFGPSDHRYLGADKLDGRHQVVTRSFPCPREGCPHGCQPRYDIAAPDYPVCMKRIDVSSVWDAIVRRLAP